MEPPPLAHCVSYKNPKNIFKKTTLMKNKAAITLLLLFFPFLTFAQENPSLRISNPSLFVEEDLGVLFAFRPSLPISVNEKAILLEIKDSKIRYRWDLLDNGTLGDQIAGDGIWSRRIQFKEKKITILDFLALSASEEQIQMSLSPGSPAPTDQHIEKVSLEIKARPTFIDIIKGIFRKIF